MNLHATDPLPPKPPGKPSLVVGYSQIRGSHLLSHLQEARGMNPYQAPQPWDLAPGRQVYRISAFEDQWGLHRESQRDLRNRGSTLKGHALNLIYYPLPSPSTEAVMKGA